MDGIRRRSHPLFLLFACLGFIKICMISSCGPCCRAPVRPRRVFVPGLHHLHRFLQLEYTVGCSFQLKTWTRRIRVRLANTIVDCTVKKKIITESFSLPINKFALFAIRFGFNGVKISLTRRVHKTASAIPINDRSCVRVISKWMWAKKFIKPANQQSGTIATAVETQCTYPPFRTLWCMTMNSRCKYCPFQSSDQSYTSRALQKLRLLNHNHPTSRLGPL